MKVVYPYRKSFSLSPNQLNPKDVVMVDVGDEEKNVEYYLAVRGVNGKIQFVQLDTCELVDLSNSCKCAIVDAELHIQD